MARPRRLIAALAAAAAVVLVGTSAAALRSLHVEALSMRGDRARVAVGEPFRLAIHVRVRESVAAVDELVVPDVGTMQLLGDERTVTSAAAGGTDVIETLTLEPTAAGAYTFAPAYLDAIDARTGRPSRFSSNPVRVVVTPRGPLAGVDGGALARRVAGVALAALGIVAAVGVLAALARRRRMPPDPVAVTPVPAAPEPRTPRDIVREALRGYRADPGEGAAMRLRGALFAAVDAPDGATLRDALALAGDTRLRPALVAAERAAFGDAAERDAAARALIDATEAWLE